MTFQVGVPEGLFITLKESKNALSKIVGRVIISGENHVSDDCLAEMRRIDIRFRNCTIEDIVIGVPLDFYYDFVSFSWKIIIIDLEKNDLAIEVEGASEEEAVMLKLKW